MILIADGWDYGKPVASETAVFQAMAPRRPDNAMV
jgi:hypothetical protein